MKQSKFIASVLFLSMILVIMPLFTTAGLHIVSENFFTATHTDSYTNLVNQDISFHIHKEITEESYKSGSDPIEGNGNTSDVDNWVGLGRVKNNIITQYSAESLEDSSETVFRNLNDDVSTKSYPQNAKDSTESLYFYHGSYVGFNGETHPISVFTQLDEMTIGEISFDFMIHLNQTKAKFYFSLDNIDNNSKMIEGYFDIQPGTGDTFHVEGNIFPLGNESGSLSNEPIQFFTGDTNNFHWMNLKIFFDTWNDLYNITVREYNENDWNFVDAGQSIQIKGEQNNGFVRTNTGKRLSGSHILDKLQFELRTNAANYKSEAWIDNIEYDYFEFPAFYADITYVNGTFGNQLNPKEWLNKTIVTSIKPPQYPNNTVSLDLNENYLWNRTNPEIINCWELAPTWMYRFPFFIPTEFINNIDVVNNTIMSLLSDSINPLEDQGTYTSEMSLLGQNSPYYDGDMGPIHTMNFRFLDEYSDIKSDGISQCYYYNSSDDSKSIRLIYSNEPSYSGSLVSFKLYEGDERNPGIVFFEVIVRKITPGYQIPLLIGALMAVSIYLIKKTKKTIKK